MPSTDWPESAPERIIFRKETLSQQSDAENGFLAIAHRQPIQNKHHGSKLFSRPESLAFFAPCRAACSVSHNKTASPDAPWSTASQLFRNNPTNRNQTKW